MDVAIVGGGPSGACLALILAQRGFTVDVFEKRADPRAAEASSASAAPFGSAFGQSVDAAKRSINLALSCRGQAALRAVGTLETVMASAVTMTGRAIHPPDGGPLVYQPYGQPGEAIYSAQRGTVNNALLAACDAHKGPGAVRLHFSHSFVSLSQDGKLEVADAAGVKRSVHPALVVGADGAFSAVRGAMLRHERVNFARKFIPHAYKELYIPANAGGNAALDMFETLHIWPRTDFMLIALPNLDKSFTLTLFVRSTAALQEEAAFCKRGSS